MTSNPPVYVAHDIPDLLNALPTMFGFRPDDSLVAIATYGPRRRLGFRLRLDLPPEADHPVVAALVAHHLTRNGAEGVILIAVGDDARRAASLLQTLQDVLASQQPVVLAVRTNGHRYWCDEPGIPTEGIEVALSDHHPVMVHAVAAGQQILPSRAAMEQKFAPVDESEAIELRRAVQSRLNEMSSSRRDAGVGSACVVTMIQRAAHGGRLTDAEVVEMTAWASFLEVRDAVWVRIDRDNAREILVGLLAVIPRVVTPGESALLSLTAFAAWLSGDGAQALMALDRALASDPDYSMARVILDVVEQGVSPATWLGWGVERSA